MLKVFFYGLYNKASQSDIGKDIYKSFNFALDTDIGLRCFFYRDPKENILNKMNSSDHFCGIQDGSVSCVCRASVVPVAHLLAIRRLGGQKLSFIKHR